MANKVPVKAIFSGSDVSSLGEFATSDTIAASYINGVPTGAMPLAGGTMTGNIAHAGAFTLDVGSEINLDSDSGYVYLKDAGTSIGLFKLTSSDFYIKSVVSDKDIIFQGNDGGSGIEAMRIDMSAGGKVGIGITAPTGDLHIHNSADHTRLNIDCSNNTGDNWQFQSRNNGEFWLRNDDESRNDIVFQPATGAAEFGASVIAKTDTDTSNTGSVTLDFAAKQNFVLTLTGNVTLANPTTEQVGQSGFIAFIQDGTGGRTVALGTDYETPAAAGLTLTSTAGATDLVPYLVVASNRILLGTPQLAFA